jgi:hypothetical protein
LISDFFEKELNDNEGLTNHNYKCSAKVYSICEPLKVRNITASNAIPYAISRGMQKFLHSSLKDYPQFKLIGRSLDSNVVNDLLNKGRKGDWIVSGDFSAATDNIKIELTKLVFEYILKKFITVERLSNDPDIMDLVQILRHVLYEHEIEYPKFSGIEPVTQCTGQLMGSTLSFPILCIINLITYWIAVEPDVKDFRDLNVMINGDDIMFKCSKARYQNWLDTLEQAGLTPSPGKNFFHEKYGTINSALFYQQSATVTKYIPFFNVGMILGQSKVARMSEEEGEKPIHCLHKDAIMGALDPIRADLRFRTYNKEVLTKSSTMYDGTVLNWYLPTTMGGLGMRLPIGVSFRTQHTEPRERTVLVTDRQRVIAYGLRNAWYNEQLIKTPIQPIGMEKDPDLENWGDIRKLVFLKAQLLDCPMLPDCDELQEEHHSPNWYLPFTGSIEKNNLKYMFKGLSWKRFGKKSEKQFLLDDQKISDEPIYEKYVKEGHIVERLVKRSKGSLIGYNMLSLDNAHMYQELQVFKRRKDRTGFSKLVEFIPPKIKVIGGVVKLSEASQDYPVCVNLSRSDIDEDSELPSVLEHFLIDTTIQ